MLDFLLFLFLVLIRSIRRVFALESQSDQRLELLNRTLFVLVQGYLLFNLLS